MFLLKNKFFQIFLFVIMVLSINLLNNNYSEAGFFDKKDNLEVYYFYHKPFGGVCSKTEEYIKNTISEHNLKNVRFQSIDINSRKGKKFTSIYSGEKKTVVIFNRKNNKIIHSSMRSLIKKDKAKKEIVTEFLSKLNSVI